MADYFKDKVVLVTGGSSGIGKALVEEGLKQGALVATCGRSLEKLETAFPNADRERLLLTATDVRNEAACAAFVNAAVERWGRVDVLINNAGITMRALFDDASLQVI